MYGTNNIITNNETLFHIFLKVGVSRARDDRLRGPESKRNSKRRKVVVSRRRNTCLWEAIITNVQNFVQPEAEPHKSLAMAWQMPRCAIWTTGSTSAIWAGFALAAEPVPQSLEFVASRAKCYKSLDFHMDCIMKKLNPHSEFSHPITSPILIKRPSPYSY